MKECSPCKNFQWKKILWKIRELKGYYWTYKVQNEVGKLFLKIVKSWLNTRSRWRFKRVHAEPLLEVKTLASLLVNTSCENRGINFSNYHVTSRCWRDQRVGASLVSMGLLQVRYNVFNLFCDLIRLPDWGVYWICRCELLVVCPQNDKFGDHRHCNSIEMCFNLWRHRMSEGLYEFMGGNPSW